MNLRGVLLPLVFLGSIASAAGVYEIIWIARPDYFRVQSGVNALPIDLYNIASVYSAYSSNDPLPPMADLSHGSDVATKRMQEVYDKFQQSSVNLSQKKAILAGLNTVVNEEYKPFLASQWAQAGKFIASEGSIFQAHIDSLRAEAERIRVAEGVSEAQAQLSTKLPTRFRELEAAINSERVQQEEVFHAARVYVMGHLIEFQKLPEQQDYIKKMHTLDQLQQEVYGMQLVVDASHHDLYLALLAYRDALLGSLNYWDFVYFSVGAATTSTFGDISPNSTPVRLLVCLQVVLSITLSGIFISKLANSIRS